MNAIRSDDRRKLRNRTQSGANIRITATLVRIIGVLLALLLVVLNLKLSHVHHRPTVRPVTKTSKDTPPFDTKSSNEGFEKGSYLVSPMSTASVSSNGDPPWKNSTTIPSWMKEYFQWHSEQRDALAQQPENWQSFKFLIVRCLSYETRCGGTADRLKPLPFYVLLAARLKRILLIHWERPAALEAFLLPPHAGLDGAFLLPPHAGLDWRMPDNLRKEYSFSERPEIASVKAVDNYLTKYASTKDHHTKSPLPVVASIRYQTHDHGADIYDSMRDSNDEASYAQVFRDCWNAVFEPVPAIQERIRGTLESLRLEPLHFHGIHIRSQYHSKPSRAQLFSLGRNAVNCLYKLLFERESLTLLSGKVELTELSQIPIYVAADNPRASIAALRYAQISHNLTNLVMRPVSEEEEGTVTLHLDRGTEFLSKDAKEWTQHEASQYYDIFVDLYILSQSRCIAVNAGNFGKWANLMSLDPSCQVSHMKNLCPWPWPTNRTLRTSIIAQTESYKY